MLTFVIYALVFALVVTVVLAVFPNFRHWLFVKLGIHDPYLDEILNSIESKIDGLLNHEQKAAAAAKTFDSMAKKSADESARAGRVAAKLKTLTE